MKTRSVPDGFADRFREAIEQILERGHRFEDAGGLIQSWIGNQFPREPMKRRLAKR